jgi:hypothetical protein
MLLWFPDVGLDTVLSTLYGTGPVLLYQENACNLKLNNQARKITVNFIQRSGSVRFCHEYGSSDPFQKLRI